MKPFVLKTLLLVGCIARASPQECSTSCATLQKDVAFLLDESGTVNGGQLNLMKNFVNSLLDCWTLAGDAVQVALVTYSSLPLTRFGLTEFNNDKEGAKAFITAYNRTEMNGGTLTQLGIAEVMDSIFTGTGGDRPQVPNCLIIMTDGDSANVNTIINKNALRPSLADCFVVGIGDEINEAEIDALASLPLVDHKFLVDRFSNLPLILPQLQEVPCPACNPICENGGQCIRSNNTCICGEIYAGTRCDECRF